MKVFIISLLLLSACTPKLQIGHCYYFETGHFQKRRTVAIVAQLSKDGWVQYNFWDVQGQFGSGTHEDTVKWFQDMFKQELVNCK